MFIPDRIRAAYAGAAPSPVSIRAESSGGVLTIDVLDFIGEDMFGAGVTAKRVSAELDAASRDVSVVRLRINSPGGSATDGAAIRSLVRSFAEERQATVSVEIHGIAASAASAIAMAGDQILMAPDALLMIHNPWSIAVGDSDDMQHVADVLDKHEQAYAKTYADRTGLPVEEIRELMAAETWMTASEAIEKGFADGELGEHVEPVAAADNERIAAALHTLGIPHSDKHNQFVAAVAGTQNQAKEKKVNPEILKVLGLSEDAGPDEILAAAQSLRGQIDDQRKVIDQARDDLKAARADTQRVREQVEREVSFSHSLDLAQATGRIEPAQADKYRARLDAAKERGSEALAFFLETASEDLDGQEVSPKVEVLQGPEDEHANVDPAFAKYIEKHGKDLPQASILKAWSDK